MCVIQHRNWPLRSTILNVHGTNASPDGLCTRTCYKALKSVIRLSLGRRLGNLLQVAQRTDTLTNGVVDRPWVIGREFESRVHDENAS